MNKEELTYALENGRESFLELLIDLDEEDMVHQQTSEGWSIKDILSHLTRWEAEIVKLLWQLRQGLKPTTNHFMGGSIDEVNARWLEEDRARPLDRILTDFHGVRNQTIHRIETFTDREITDELKYPFLKGKPLWEWIADDSFYHEVEHINQVEEIRAALNLQNKAAN